MRPADGSESLILRQAQDEMAGSAFGNRGLESLGEDHLGIAGGVKVRQGRGRLVASGFIESPRRRVIGPPRGIDIKPGSTKTPRAALRLTQQAPSDAAALRAFGDRDP